MTPLNTAGSLLRDLALSMGDIPVRLRYRPADNLVTRETYALWIEPEDGPTVVGTGDTADEALADAMKQMEATDGA